MRIFFLEMLPLAMWYTSESRESESSIFSRQAKRTSSSVSCGYVFFRRRVKSLKQASVFYMMMSHSSFFRCIAPCEFRLFIRIGTVRAFSRL